MTPLGEPHAPLLNRADSPVVDALAPSPNHGERHGGRRPDWLILHYTGMADGPSALRWLRDPVSQVSCHYVVEEDGRVLQLVAEARRAWHAGRSTWQGETDLNSASIGIEIVNPGHEGGLPPYPEAQIAAVVALCRDIVDRQAISPARVLAHSDIAPGRKQDPGERFPWAHLAAAGLGLWVAPNGSEAEAPNLNIRALQERLKGLGYGAETTGLLDAGTKIVIRAFQLHFRPSCANGQPDCGTVDTATRLLAAARSSAGGGLLPLPATTQWNKA